MFIASIRDLKKDMFVAQVVSPFRGPECQAYLQQKIRKDS